MFVRDSQESSVLDELAAGSSQVHNAGVVSSTDFVYNISKLHNTFIMKSLLTLDILIRVVACSVSAFAYLCLQQN